MKKVYIEFDPYNMKTSVVVDGKKVQENKHCDNKLKEYLNTKTHIPIQAWIDPVTRDGWKGLLYTLCQMGDKDIVIEFAGRKIDYEYIKNSISAQNKTMKCGANLTFCELKEEIPTDIDMQKNIDSVIKLMLNTEFADVVNTSNSPALIKKYKNLESKYHEIDQKEFRIIFVGTYSSGKSSTINALIGKNILPTSSGTCTSKICSIKQAENSSIFATLIYTYKDKKYLYECNDEEEIQNKIMLVEDKVEEVEVYTDLSKLYPDGIDKSFKIVIVDTPGTDSATGNDTRKTNEIKTRLSNKSHIEITKEALRSNNKEMVILISGDKFEDDNIVELLDLIEGAVEDDGGAFNDRFLFVMNKCDSLHYTNAGETLENYVKNFIVNIKKVPNSSRIRNIVNPRIYPVSSGVALAVANGFVEKPPKEKQNAKQSELYYYYRAFCEKIYYYEPNELANDIDETKMANSNYCLEEQSAINEYEKQEFVSKLKQSLKPQERMMIHSGIPALEIAIKEYILHYAYIIKVRQLLASFVDILTEIETFNNNTKEELKIAKDGCKGAVTSKQGNEEEEGKKEKRKKILEEAEKKMGITRGEIDSIKETVPEINAIRASFMTMKNSIGEEIGEKIEVEVQEGEKIIASISKKVDKLLAEIKDKVREVKEKKKEAAESLYDDFMGYIKDLEAAGLLKDGAFKLRDTVAYKEIVDKQQFKGGRKSEKDEKNYKKEYIEFDYGIGNFFESIGRAWKTRKEPETIKKSYINISQYVNDNIDPIAVEVDKYIETLKNAYASDVKDLKTNTNNRIYEVLALIKQEDMRIKDIRDKARKNATDQQRYQLEIDRLTKNEEILNRIKDKIEYTNLRGIYNA